MDEIMASTELSPVHRIARPLAWLWFGLLLLLTVCDYSATRVFTWPWYAYAQLLWLAPVILTAALVFTRPKAPSLGAALDATMLGLGVVVVASAHISLFKSQSYAWAIPYLSGIACVYAGASLLEGSLDGGRSPRLWWRAVGAFFALVFALSLRAWLQECALPAMERGTGIPRNWYPFGHSTYTAGFAILAGPWLCWLAWVERGAMRWVWLLTCVLGAAVLMSAGSRATAVGVALMAAAVVLLALRSQRLSRRALLALTFGGVALLAVTIFTNARLRELVLTGHWSTVAENSNRQRAAMNTAGLLMLKERPLLGHGPGTVPLVYPTIRGRLEGGVENVLQLHSAPVQLGAELGGLGVAFAATTLLLLMFRGWRNLKALAGQESSFNSPIFPAVIGLVGYSATALTDYQLDVLGITSVVALYVAIIVAAAPVPRRDSAAFGRLLKLAVIAAIVCRPALAVWNDGRARQLFDSAFDALADNDVTAFNERCEKAAVFGFGPVYYNQIAATLLQSSESNREAAAAVRTKARRYFEHSLALYSQQEYVNFNLGWLCLETGDVAAYHHFHLAAQLVPDKGGVYLGAALALLARGHRDEAVTALALECVNDPAFITSGWWGTPEIGPLRKECAKRAGQWLTQSPEFTSIDAPRQRECAYVAALLGWVVGEQSSAALPPLCSTENRRQFFETPRDADVVFAAKMQSYRRQRTGYPVVMRYPDVPPPIDLYPVLDNAKAAGPLAYLFPAKGWLPTDKFAKLTDRVLFAQ